MKKFWLFSAVSLACCLFCSGGVSLANTAPSSSGLSVSPAISKQNLNPNQNQIILNQTIINISGQPLLINVRSQDFGSIGNAGTINFYSPTKYKPSSNPHGLQNSIGLSSKQFALQPDSKFNEQVTISNTLSLAPGGHYGAVVYTPDPISTPNSPTKIGLTPSVASLIFITTAGGGTQHLSISNILQSDISVSLPRILSFIVANSGNTQSTPIGYVKLIGPGNKLIAQNDINNTSSLVLPSSSILMNVNLSTHGSFSTKSGIYKLQIVYGYAGSSKLTSLTKSFLYINIPLLLTQVAVIILLFLVIWKILKIWHRRQLKSRRNRLIINDH